MMTPYLISVAVGLLVGVIYGVINVRSPAPPVIALIGLLGILIGEQVVPLARGAVARPPITISLPQQPEAGAATELGESGVQADARSQTSKKAG